MRIDAPKTTGIRAYQKRQESVRKTAGTTQSSGLGTTSSEIAVAGIPEGELTPRVQQAILSLMAEVNSLREELRRRDDRLEELERLADEDPLTRLFNRRAFVREITRFTAYAERYDTPSSILFFDVNGLKTINDTYGHAAGDKALVHVSDCLRKNVRSTDVVGRLGGDEFGILLAHTDAEGAKVQGHRLAEAVQDQHLALEDARHQVSVAWGCHMISPGSDISDALRAADQKMYRHKRGEPAE